MRFGFALLAVSMLAVACSNAQHPQPSPAAATNLRFTGFLRGTISPPDSSNRCVLNHPNRGQLTLETPSMSLADGHRVRVTLTFRPSPGVYSAVVPTVGGVTPVRIEELTPSDGSVTALFTATSGTVQVTVANHVGESGSTGLVSGFVNAQLAVACGAQAVSLTGKWGCSFSNNV